MPIPDFQTLMRPTLEVLSDGREHNMAELREALASRFDMTDDERDQLLPSGTQRVFDNRVT
jgi:restriction system protein